MQDPALGKNLREQRVAANKTQATLASESGVGLRTLQEIEAGNGTTIATVRKLAFALGVPAGSLLDAEPVGEAS